MWRAFIAACFALYLSTSAHAQIAFVNSADIGDNGGTTNSRVVSYTVTAGSTLLIIVILGDDVSTGFDDFTAVSYGASNATLWLKDTNGNFGVNRNKYIYAIYSPPSGANNVSITTTNNHYIFAGVAEYKGTVTSGPVDSSSMTNAGNGASSVTGSTTTVANNAWVLGFVEAQDDSNTPPTAGAGATIRMSGPTFGNWAYFDSNGAKTPAGSYSMTASQPSPPQANYAMIMDNVSFAPSVLTSDKGIMMLMGCCR